MPQATFAGGIIGTSAQFIDTTNPDGGGGAGEGGSLTVEGRRDGTANLISLRARDASAPTAALPNGQGGLIRWQGFDGSDFAQMGAIAVVADGQAVANSDAPSKMIFYTTADGGEALTTALTLDKSQNATFANLVTVGPGTTGSPYDATTFLHVKGTTRSVVQQSSTDDAYYMFGDAAANNVAWLGYNHSTNQLSLHTSGTTYTELERLYLELYIVHLTVLQGYT